MEKTNFQYIQDTQTLIGNRTRELLDVETGRKNHRKSNYQEGLWFKEFLEMLSDGFSYHSRHCG